MKILEDHERQQSGVRTILAELQKSQEAVKMECIQSKVEDLMQEALRTQWYRGQFAILSHFIDKIENSEYANRSEEGIGEAALPPSQQ